MSRSAYDKALSTIFSFNVSCSTNSIGLQQLILSKSSLQLGLSGKQFARPPTSGQPCQFLLLCYRYYVTVSLGCNKGCQIPILSPRYGLVKINPSIHYSYLKLQPVLVQLLKVVQLTGPKLNQREKLIKCRKYYCYYHYYNSQFF